MFGCEKTGKMCGMGLEKGQGGIRKEGNGNRKRNNMGNWRGEEGREGVEKGKKRGVWGDNLQSGIVKLNTIV